MTPFVPADQEQRQRAIETQDRPLVVDAGAGTGKTTLLISRLLFALENELLEIPGVVAISFTEKAAAELRLRLRRAIEQRLAETEDLAKRTALQRALENYHRARVSTIHAFAASLLRERPLEAGVDPRFHMLDELESMQLQVRFWKSWVQSELNDPDTEKMLVEVLPLGVQLEPDLFQLARALYENRDFSITSPAAGASLELQARMQGLRKDVLRIVDHGRQHCHDSTDRGFRHLQELEQQMDSLRYRPVSSWTKDFLYSLKIKYKYGRRDAWAPGEGDRNKKLRQELQAQFEALAEQLQSKALSAALQWMRRYLSAFEEEKRRLGVLDFSDLLLKARDLVRNDIVIRRELGQRIQTLCVDEFQDTDPLQAELVLYLSEAPARSSRQAATHWEDVAVSSKLFLVGDPKQSIYRFRRADLGLYQRCCEIVRREGGEVLDITQNFRSRPAILSWVNQVFARVFAGSEQPDRRTPRFVPLRSSRPGSSSAHVWVLQHKLLEAGPGEVRQSESDAIARMIHRMLSESWKIPGANGERKLRHSDIAVLFGRTSGIEIYEEALRRAGIAFRQEGGKLFFQRPEVRDVLSALAAIEDPHDELSIVAALRSPLFGMGDDELWQHRTRCGRFDYTASQPATPVQDAFDVLSELHRDRHEAGCGGTIETLLDRTHARAVYMAQAAGPRAVANFEALVRQAHRFEQNQEGGLRDFVLSMSEMIRDAPRLAEWAPEEVDSGQVRLLTVHMAKGLEFPVVFLANLSTRANFQSPPLIVDALQGRAEVRLQNSEYRSKLTTPGYSELLALDRRYDEEEEKRLLYVAATRAREHLIIGDFHGARIEGYLKTLYEAPECLEKCDEETGRRQVLQATELARLPFTQETPEEAPPQTELLLQKRRRWLNNYQKRQVD